MKKRVPKLRFPEFSGEWEEKKVNEILQDSKGAIKIGPFGSALKKDIYVRKGIKVFTQENIFQNDFTLGNYYVTEEKYRTLKSCELEPDDIVFSMMGTIGNCAVFPHHCEKGIMNSHLLRIQLNNEINPLFFYHQYSSPLVQRQIKKLSVGSIMSGLSSSIVSNIRIDYPSTLEQQKIADFLSTVDNIIASEQRILDDLQLKKKGLMQKLFSRLLRFKDKNRKVFPEWEEKRLGAVADILSGKRIPVGDTFAKDDTGLKYITVSDMDEKYVNSENIQFISSRVESKIKKYKVKTGDIIIAIVGATIGKLNMIPSSLNNANLTENCDKFTNYKSVIPEFLYSLLKSDLVRKEIDSQKTVSAQPKLALDRLRNFIFLFPSIPEQQKIADCLGLLDNVIEEQQKVVAGWKLRKNGLLQQMFV